MDGVSDTGVGAAIAPAPAATPLPPAPATAGSAVSPRLAVAWLAAAGRFCIFGHETKLHILFIGYILFFQPSGSAAFFAAACATHTDVPAIL